MGEREVTMARILLARKPKTLNTATEIHGRLPNVIAYQVYTEDAGG